VYSTQFSQWPSLWSCLSKRVIRKLWCLWCLEPGVCWALFCCLNNNIYFVYQLYCVCLLHAALSLYYTFEWWCIQSLRNFMLLTEAEDSPLKAIGMCKMPQPIASKCRLFCDELDWEIFTYSLDLPLHSECVMCDSLDQYQHCATDFGLAVFFDPKDLPLKDLGMEGTPWCAQLSRTFCEDLFTFCTVSNFLLRFVYILHCLTPSVTICLDSTQKTLAFRSRSCNTSLLSIVSKFEFSNHNWLVVI
jgi:hypothetical protein